MKTTSYLQKERAPAARPFPVSVALLLVIVGINITATVLSLLAALPGCRCARAGNDTRRGVIARPSKAKGDDRRPLKILSFRIIARQCRSHQPHQSRKP